METIKEIEHHIDNLKQNKKTSRRKHRFGINKRNLMIIGVIITAISMIAAAQTVLYMSNSVQANTDIEENLQLRLYRWNDGTEGGTLPTDWGSDVTRTLSNVKQGENFNFVVDIRNQVDDDIDAVAELIWDGPGDNNINDFEEITVEVDLGIDGIYDVTYTLANTQIIVYDETSAKLKIYFDAKEPIIFSGRAYRVKVSFDLADNIRTGSYSIDIEMADPSILPT